MLTYEQNLKTIIDSHLTEVKDEIKDSIIDNILRIKALKREPCEDCISRQAVMEYIENCTVDLGYVNGTNIALDAISEMPSVQPKTGQEPKKGRLIYNQYDGNSQIGNWHCSECGRIIFVPYHTCDHNYCSYCGAKLESEE